MNMNRRSFLKSVGAMIMGLGFLPQTKAGLTVADVRRSKDVMEKNNVPPFKIDGEEYYMFGSKDGYIFEGEWGSWEGVRFIETA